MNNDIEKFVIELSKLTQPTAEDILKLQRSYAKKNNSSFFMKDALLEVYQKMLDSGTIVSNKSLERLFQIKTTRSQSGIVVVSVLTKPYACSGRCIYCPTEANMPKSYLSTEPAVMRAISCDFHPYRQVWQRLSALKAAGHITDKISIRIIGGTWSEYPRQYRSWYIRELFRACNEFNANKKYSQKSLAFLQQINEDAACRIVELSVETRQDRIDEGEIRMLRKFGVTKVELGVQTIKDEILILNKRGTDNARTIAATKMLKDAGFKISYQMMLNLYGSDLKIDREVFEQLFFDANYKPDHLKIYPLALVKNSELNKKYRKGEFKPYTRQELIELICDIKLHIPTYCRVERVIRDIPAAQIIEGGAKISNLRQEVARAMSLASTTCRCIRCSEIKNRAKSGSHTTEVLEYFASDGMEYFITAHDDRSGYLLGFCRLRITSEKPIFPVLNNAALLREIHVYGPTVALGTHNGLAAQHHGIGKELMAMAEEIASSNGMRGVAVIAGVGVRGYFRKLGYLLRQSYMFKSLAQK